MDSINIFYYKSGKKEIERFYNKGILNGTYKKWDEDGNLKHTANYKNDSLNGYGKFDYGYWGDSMKYEGNFKNNIFDGQGTMTWIIGNNYVGEWKNGNFHGEGTYKWANGDKYIGEWKDNKFDGQGTLTLSDGKVYEGLWENDILVNQSGNEEFENKRIIEKKKKSGCISGNCYNGFGTYTWTNGNKYVGKWKNGKKDGYGTYTWANGNKYVGKWLLNKRHGQGTQAWSDGSKWTGTWENGNFKGNLNDKEEVDDETKNSKKFSFYDSFSDNRNGWDVKNTLISSSGSLLFYGSSNGYKNWIVNTFLLNKKENFLIETEFSFYRKNLIAKKNNGAGITFGGDITSSRMYEFRITSSGEFVIYDCVSSDKTNIIKSWTFSSSIREKWGKNRLTIKGKIGGLISFYINGYEVFKTSSINEFYGNEIGFVISGKNDISIDYLKIENTE